MRHFGFLNQTEAGFRNIKSLFDALTPIIDGDHEALWGGIKERYWEVAGAARSEVFRRKLGVSVWDEQVEALLAQLLDLMETTRADWTITFRQLAHLLEAGADPQEQLALLRLEGPKSKISDEESAAWKEWIRGWLSHVDASGVTRAESAAMIREASPKYVAREWMLIAAYTAAEYGDYEPARELSSLLARPYAEQLEFEEKYFRKKTVSPMG